MVMRLCVILFLFFSTHVGAQNLVPNPGFEDYQRLPCGLNEFAIHEVLQSWREPIPTSTDYWHTQSGEDCYCNPARLQSEPHSGFGMVGIITGDIQLSRKVEYKEYAEVKLIQPLAKGSFYHANFHARNRAILDTNVDKMFANRLGMAFSDSLISIFTDLDSPDHLLMKPAIVEDNSIIAGWREVNGCFIAASNAEYLLIGNFSSIDSTNLTLANPNSRFAQAYYFIDDVSVEKLPYDVSSLENRVTMCYDDESIQLNATIEGAISYRWKDGSEGAVTTYSQKTNDRTYVDIIFDECTYRHNFQIDYIPKIQLGTDTILCSGPPFMLYPKIAVKNLVWWDNSVTDVKFVDTSGIYSASVNVGDCSSEDNIQIDFLDCPGFIPNIITPNDDNLNDYLVFENIQVLEWSLQIFNRWGQAVYMADHYMNEWDGDDVPPGTYYYRLFSRKFDREVKGIVSVVR